MKKIMLDTNAYSHLMKGDNRVLEVIAAAEVVFMSIFVLGELYAGFFGSKKNRENQDILKRFLSKPPVRILNTSSETAKIFGSLKNALRHAGTPVPISDVWIAALAVETGSVIVTYDKHFQMMQGIRLWNGN